MRMEMKRKPADRPHLSSSQYVCDEKGKDEDVDMDENGEWR